MPISSKQFFTEQSKTDQISAILYMERIPSNYDEILNSSGYGYICSPVHAPAEDSKKPHIHVIIRDMHGHFLDFQKVDELLESLNEDHARAVVLRGGHAALVSMARYMVHMNDTTKQQFDLRSPEELSGITIDEKGLCSDTGLTSIYAENYCFYDGGGLDFIKLIHLTVREVNAFKRETTKQMLEKCLDYIYSEGVYSYAKFVQWARKNGYIDCVIAFNSLLHNVVSSNGNKDINSDATTSETDSHGDKSTMQDYEEDSLCSSGIDCTGFDYTVVGISDINDMQDALCTALDVSTVNQDIVKFFCWLHPNIALTDMKYNKRFVKRKFLECYDLLNDKPRQKFKLAFDSFCVEHLQCLII